jgi:dTDP-glucose 4,6-dehydratase
MIFVTGGAGFIGGNFVLDWLDQESRSSLINIDALTYAGNLSTLQTVQDHPRYQFVKVSIGDQARITQLLKEHQPSAIINFAAESHVDRSIHGPAEFIHTNIVGTFNLLECARSYWNDLPEPQKSSFRFLHVSTDEVYGSLGPNDPPFTEKHPSEVDIFGST